MTTGSGPTASLDETVEQVVTKTAEYLGVPAVVGFEPPFLDHLEREFEAAGLSTKRTPRVLKVNGCEPGRISATV